MLRAAAAALAVATALPARAATATATAAPVPAPPAVIEHALTDIAVQRDGTFVTTRAVVIRIDSEAAARSGATVPIPVSASLQRFELVEAWTQTADGRRVDVAPASVLTQAPPYAAQTQTLSDVQLKVVNFPGVAVGARLHLTTRVAQIVPIFPGVFTYDTSVGRSTVLLDGEVRIAAPAAMPLGVDAAGVEAVPPIVAGDVRHYAWRFRQPTFTPAVPNAVAPIDGEPRLIVTSLPDWAALGRAYQERATAREQPSPAIRALAASITAGQRDDRARAAALAGWVARNVRYVNIVLGVGGFVPPSADEVAQARFGDCKGHATLLNALLAAANIPSTSVLINAGPTYREPAVAGQVFNHMINYLPGLDTFVDTTSPYAAFGDLPLGDRAKFVVLTRTGEARRTPAAGPQPEGLAQEFTLAVTADGGIDGRSRIVPQGALRGELGRLSDLLRAGDQAQAVSRLMQANGSLGTGALTLPATREAPELAATWHVDDAVATSGTGALRPPYGVALSTIAQLAASATAPVAAQPVLCQPLSLNERFAITFPAGYTLMPLPGGVSVDTAEVSYHSTWQRDGQTVRITRSYASRFAGPTCSPEAMRRFQDAKRQIARDTSAQIVYSKTTG